MQTIYLVVYTHPYSGHSFIKSAHTKKDSEYTAIVSKVNNTK